MERTIIGLVADELGDWVAELSCQHRRHLRHEPPFVVAPWVESAAGRASRIGAALECELCDRAELPEGLRLVRTTATWDERSAPPALRRHHRIAPGTWGVLVVDVGALRFVAASPELDLVVRAGNRQPIPPEVEHHVEVDGPVRFRVEFHRR